MESNLKVVYTPKEVRLISEGGEPYARVKDLLDLINDDIVIAPPEVQKFVKNLTEDFLAMKGAGRFVRTAPNKRKPTPPATQKA